MNSIPTNQQMSTESPLVIHTGSLLSNLDQETQARVLELRYMRHPLVEAKTPFARMIQLELEKSSYFDIKFGHFIRIKVVKGYNKLGESGVTTSYGYRVISIKTFKIRRSHLVYLWFTGDLPKTKEEIDHIDGNPSNDSPSNLRLVSRELNCRNTRKKCHNTSGYTGVYWNKNTAKWRALAFKNGLQIHLGLFNRIEDAYEARQAWIKNNPELGYTTRHGN